MFCRNCIHFYLITYEFKDKMITSANVGYCKRFPPVYVGSFSNDLPTFITNEVVRWKQPMVYFNDHCGEWQENEYK